MKDDGKKIESQKNEEKKEKDLKIKVEVVNGLEKIIKAKKSKETSVDLKPKLEEMLKTFKKEGKLLKYNIRVPGLAKIDFDYVLESGDGENIIINLEIKDVLRRAN